MNENIYNYITIFLFTEPRSGPTILSLQIVSPPSLVEANSLLIHPLEGKNAATTSSVQLELQWAVRCFMFTKILVYGGNICRNCTCYPCSSRK